jgi:hypothetical protein
MSSSSYPPAVRPEVAALTSDTSVNRHEKIDVEHLPVDDDPRKWGNRKKTLVGIFCPICPPCLLGP